MISSYYFILFACETRSKLVSKPMNSLSTLNQEKLLCKHTIPSPQPDAMDLLWSVFPQISGIFVKFTLFIFYFFGKNWIKCQAVFFVFLWGNSTLVPKWFIHCAAAAYYLFLSMFWRKLYSIINSFMVCPLQSWVVCFVVYLSSRFVLYEYKQ